MARQTLEAGLCQRCRWQRLVPGLHTVFSLCTRSVADPAFPKYPVLPVTRCAGFDPVSTPDAGTDGPETVS